MTNTDWNEWRLIDSDLVTVLGILPASESHLYLALNEPGSGELKIPLLTEAAGVVASGQFAVCSYRGAVRGGFFIENISKGQADASEGAGQWVSISGRGALSLLDDAMVWSEDISASTRDFTDMSRAEILITLIDEAQTRGGLVNLTYDFSATLDSVGQSWSDSETLKLPVGTSLLDVVRQFARSGIDFDILPDAGAFVLSAYKLGKGSDKSETVYMRTGVDCEEITSDEHGDKIKNALLVAYKAGYISVTDGASITDRRRREKLLDLKMAQTSSSATTIGAAEVELSKDPKKSISVKIYDGVGPRAFVDYELGDYIMLDVQGVETRYRIYGIQPDWSANQFSKVIVELNSILYENDIQMAQDIAWLMDQWNTANDADLLEVAYWAAIGSGNDVVTKVNVVKLNGRELWVGGTFDKIGNIDTPIAGVAIYNLDTGVWSSPTIPPLSHQDVSDFCFIGSDVYVSNNGSNLFKYSAGVWTNVLQTPPLTRIRCLATDGTNLYFGGDFDQASNTESGAVTVNYVAKLDPSTNIITALDTGLGFEVFCLLWSGSALYAGGSFAEKVKSWSGSAWISMGGGLDGTVLTLVEYGTSILAGGEQTGFISEWNSSSWAIFGGGVGDVVRGIGVYLTDVYPVGDFVDVGNHIARFSGGYWSMLGTGLNNDAYTIVMDNNNPYVGGIFDTAGDKPAKMAAAYFNTFEALVNYLENSSNNFDMGAAIHNAPASAITDLDEVPFWENVANKLRKITWANIKETLFPSSGANRVMLTDTDGKPTTDSTMYWNDTEHNISLGGEGGAPVSSSNVPLALLAKTDDAQVVQTMWTWGDSLLTSPALAGYRSGGTKASPTALQSGMRMFGFLGFGHDGTNWVGSVARMLIKATENWTGSAHGAGIYFEGTPNGSTTRTEIAKITGAGIDIPTGENYMINGVPISNGTPGGSDTNVQYNDGGVFGGDGNFVWNKTTRTLTLEGDSAAATVQGVADGSSDGLTLFGGDASATDANGGKFFLNSGNGNGSGNGGTLLVSAGNGGDTDGVGGNTTVKAGNGGDTNGNGGNLTLKAGDASGSGTDGKLQLQDPSSAKNAILNISSLSADRIFTFPNSAGTLALTSDITGTNSGTNTGDETAARIATINHGTSAKTSLVDADEITGQDSAASFGLIRTTWTNIKAFLKTYFDTLYAVTAKGVTNGDSHDHNGGDGAVIPLAGMANLAANSIIGNNTGSSATPLALTVAQVKTLLGLDNGTYTPTLTNSTNVAASVCVDVNYIRVGNQVTMNGIMQVDTTAIGAFLMYMTIPIASDFTSVNDANGNGTNPLGTVPSIISFREDVTNNRLQLDGYAQSNANTFYRFVVGYIVK